MQELESFLVFIRKFNSLNIQYMTTGSVAGIVYGEPRLTHDIDIVLKIFGDHASQICKIFPPDEFYCPPEEVIRTESCRESRGNFNIIHHETGFKADIYLIGKDPLHLWAFAKRRKIEINGEPVFFAPPEYVVIRKLEYYKEGGAEKHIRDIKGILSVSKDIIDINELHEKISSLGLDNFWNKANS
jgi:hypothetical protein